MSFVAALIFALRLSLAGGGFREFAAILRREREARHGRSLSRPEKIEHRGAAFVLLACVSYVGFFVALGLKAGPPVPGLLVVAAVAFTVVGVGHSLVADVERERGH